jgi:hypothetical protein
MPRPAQSRLERGIKFFVRSATLGSGVPGSRNQCNKFRVLVASSTK